MNIQFGEIKALLENRMTRALEQNEKIELLNLGIATENEPNIWKRIEKHNQVTLLNIE